MKIRLADKSDDAGLRKLLRETVMPGHIKMIYAREPNFFDGIQYLGNSAQVIVADDNSRIVGVGCRSVSSLYVNSEPQPVGYLSGLRVAPFAQNGTVLARGYAFVKKLHSDNKTPAYLTTIIAGNQRAQQILTSKRAGLPSYAPMGDYLVHVLPVRTSPSKVPQTCGLGVMVGAQGRKPEVIKFLDQHGSRRQFFPVHKMTDDRRGAGIIDSIGIENILVAQKGGQITGVMAVWNQERTKQHIVAGYSRLFRLLRPCLNAGLRMKGCYPLPPAGQQLRYATAALVCIENDDSDVFRILLHHALGKVAADGLHQFALGLHERDPLCSCMKEFFHVVYRSSLYIVSYNGNSFQQSLDKTRMPYLELGTL